MTAATFPQTNRLLAHCLEQLESHSATTSPQLTAAQNALLAYLRFDKIAEDEGFAMLIAKGLGEELLFGELLPHLIKWHIPDLPQIIEQAQELYRQHHQAILQQTEPTPENLRQQFPQFAPLDEQYFMQCEDIFPKIYTHVRQNYPDFEALLHHQAA